MTNNNNHNKKDIRDPSFLFYDGKENLNLGVEVNTDIGPREAQEDIPTVSYNPGDVTSVFYSGFQR